VKLILASKSVARQNMLRAAGLDFDAHPADIDESLIQNANFSAFETAQSLASEKALKVAEKFPDRLVIGSDQILACESKMLHKASSIDEASEKLKILRGKSHQLISAISVVRGDKVLWQEAQTASLTMHNFSDEFLANYLNKAGEALTRSVGAYELESIGVQLFDKIEGDYFTILGMPLLPLLTYLRQEQGLVI